MTRLRLVALADTHTFERDLGDVPEGDLFIHAGDLCRYGTLEELAGPAAFIRALPHRHKIVVAGNHDGCFINEPQEARALLGPEVTYLQDAAVTFAGVSFWGSPWSPAFGGWAFNLARGEPLAEKWALIPAGTDVLVTHGPPLGYGDGVPVAGRQGCADLLAAVRRVRPRLHLFGHIHQEPGLWREGETTLANVTTNECELAVSVIDFDPTSGEVSPVVLAG